MMVGSLKETIDDRYQLEMAISSEKAAYENYRDLTDIVKSKKAKKLLAEAAEDEKGHFLALAEKYNELFKNNLNFENVGRATGPFCDALWHFLSEEEKQDQKLKITRIFELAMFEERASIAMYTRAAQKTAMPDLKEFFLRLAETEKRHLLALRALKSPPGHGSPGLFSS